MSEDLLVEALKFDAINCLKYIYKCNNGSYSAISIQYFRDAGRKFRDFVQKNYIV